MHFVGLFLSSILKMHGPKNKIGPKPPPKRCLHIVRSKASSFKWEYPLLSSRSSSSFLRLLPRLLATSISPFIFPSISCFRRQFLRKMWPIQLAFHYHTKNLRIREMQINSLQWTQQSKSATFNLMAETKLAPENSYFSQRRDDGKRFSQSSLFPRKWVIL